MPPYSKKAKYTHKKVEDKENFDSRSFRVITLGTKGKKATKGEWSPSKNKCKVGTRIQKPKVLLLILHQYQDTWNRPDSTWRIAESIRYY